VSSHFLIRRDVHAVAVRALRETRLARRACRQWCGRERLQRFFDRHRTGRAADDVAFSDAQYECLVCAGAGFVCPLSRQGERRPFLTSRLARKTDPGRHFSWSRYFSAWSLIVFK